MGANWIESWGSISWGWEGCSGRFVLLQSWNRRVWRDWYLACTAILARKDVPHWEHPDDIALIRSTLRFDQEFNDVSSILCHTMNTNETQYPVRQSIGFEESDDDEYWVSWFLLRYYEIKHEHELAMLCISYMTKWGILRYWHHPLRLLVLT
jgi:hypothetical protein